MISKINKKTKKIVTNSNKIRGLMYLRGFSVSKLAKTLGITSTYLSYVIHGDRFGYRIRKAMAEVLQVPYGELWGSEDKPRKAA